MWLLFAFCSHLHQSRSLRNREICLFELWRKLRFCVLLKTFTSSLVSGWRWCTTWGARMCRRIVSDLTWLKLINEEGINVKELQWFDNVMEGLSQYNKKLCRRCPRFFYGEYLGLGTCTSCVRADSRKFHVVSNVKLFWLTVSWLCVDFVRKGRGCQMGW